MRYEVLERLFLITNLILILTLKRISPIKWGRGESSLEECKWNLDMNLFGKHGKEWNGIIVYLLVEMRAQYELYYILS